MPKQNKTLVRQGFNQCREDYNSSRGSRSNAHILRTHFQELVPLSVLFIAETFVLLYLRSDKLPYTHKRFLFVPNSLIRAVVVLVMKGTIKEIALPVIDGVH